MSHSSNDSGNEVPDPQTNAEADGLAEELALIPSTDTQDQQGPSYRELMEINGHYASKSKLLGPYC